MKVSTCFLITTFAATAILGASPIEAAEPEGRDIHTLIEANKNACRDVNSRQLRGLKLAAKAEQGVQQFVRYVQFNRSHLGWTSEEAVKMAKAAAVSPCGVAIGLKPIEKTAVADYLIER
jgi:hypothetical protein